ncbi:hypothetical protein D1007_26168 [Hordeum vulgare]|nr:hypothetical protein D1007_26168 [Hordeum vulgare]
MSARRRGKVSNDSTRKPSDTEKQAKMLEIEAIKAGHQSKRSPAPLHEKEVEIMKVDLSTVSPRKRSWFEKMQVDMLNLDD